MVYHSFVNVLSNQRILLLALSLVAAVAFFSCVSDADFEVQPISCNDPNLKATITVENLKKSTLVAPYRITKDDIVQAYVVSNDENGNFFKTLSLVSSDGQHGFVVEIDKESLYTLFEPGREVFIKGKGLYIGSENDDVALGVLFDGSIGRLPATVADLFVIRGCKKLSEGLILNKIKLNEINNTRLHQLVELDSVQFSTLSANSTYFDSKRTAGSGTNQTIEDKEGNTLIVRISEFADFAQALVPSKLCKIKGVLQKFRSDFQLIIRGTSDVSVIGDRQVWGFSTDPVEGEKRTIQAIRDSFAQGITQLSSTSYIEGIVTMSPTSTNNFSSTRNIFIQDESAGILLRFAKDSRLIEGHKIRVQLNRGSVLAQFAGLLQLDNIQQNRDVEVVPTAQTLPSPQLASIQDVLDGKYESQLVQIEAVQFLQIPALYSGSTQITDSEKLLTVYTQSGASFSTEAVASGNGPIVGIASIFNNRQLLLPSAKSTEKMTGARLDVNLKYDLLTITDLRARPESNIADNAKIKGIVTSDRSSQNLQENNFFLQDATAGILIRLSSPHTYDLGEELEINIQGAKLETYRGLLQVNNIKPNQIISFAKNKPLLPTVVTLQDFLDGKHEGLLVKLEGVQFKESGTYVQAGNGTNLTIDQCTTGKSLLTFIRSDATFGSSTVDQGNGSIVGIATVFNTPQLYIRGESDVQFSGTRETCTTAPPPSGGTSQVLITEISDLNNPSMSGGRFVEIYNAGTKSASLGGWSIRRYTNGKTTLTNVHTIPEGTNLAAGAFYIVANSEETFTGLYTDVVADVYTSSVSMNGDDGVALVDASDAVVDLFGVVGEDGSGKAWEYTDGGAFRNVDIASASATFTIAEWTIVTDVGAGTGLLAPDGFTPRARNLPDLSIPPETELTLTNLRARAQGAMTDNVRIRGVVTSDKDAGNLDIRNLFLQQGDAGIQLRFDAAHDHALGDSISITIRGANLGDFSGLLQLSGVDAAQTTTHARGKTVVPVMISLTQFLTGSYQSRLVRIENVQFEQSGTYVQGGNNTTLTIQNCATDESTTAHIRLEATFGSSTVDQGNGSIVGVATVFNTPQLYIRGESDVQLSGARETCTTAPPPSGGTPQVLITEISDLNNPSMSGGRFVEIYNAGTESASLGGWSIRRYTNGKTTLTNVHTIPEGTNLAAGAFYIVANSEETFTGLYTDVVADVYTSSVSMNGDDGVALVDASDAVVDLFGVVGEDGSDKAWEYTDGGAFRNVDIASASATFTIAEWTIVTDVGAGIGLLAPDGFTPRARNLPDLSIPPETELTLTNLRARAQGAMTDNVRIRGVVTSDKDAGNLDIRNLFLQQGDAGIQLRFDAAHDHALGDSISITIRGANLGDFSGLLQLSGVDATKTTTHARGKTVVPVMISLTQFLTGSYQSRLVRIENVQFEQSGTYVQGGNNTTLTIQNCATDESTTAHIRLEATFGSSTIDQGNGSIVGVATAFNTPQLYIRGESDVQLSGARETCTTAPPPSGGTPQVLITEISDLNNPSMSGGRFVEIYNAGTESASLGGWSIRRYTNGKTTLTNVYTIPEGTNLAAGAFYIVANNEATFTGLYTDVVADAYTGSVSMNGDDGVALVDASDAVVDLFGVVGEDGSGKAWEYTDGGAFRNVDITSASATFTIAEWTIVTDVVSGTGLLAPDGFTPRARNLP